MKKHKPSEPMFKTLEEGQAYMEKLYEGKWSHDIVGQTFISFMNKPTQEKSNLQNEKDPSQKDETNNTNGGK